MSWSTFLAAIYTVAVVAAVAVWVVVGDRWWSQLVNLTTLWWTLPAVPLLVLALGFRRWIPALLLLVPVGVLIWAYGGLFLPGGAEAATSDLRVASYNVWFRRPDVSHVLDLVDDERPDLLLVQELRPELVDQLREGLRPELAHGWYEPAGFAGGVGVFSRYEIVEVRPVAGAEEFARPTAVVVVEVPDGDGRRRLQVVASHLMPVCPVCGPSFGVRQRREVASRSREIAAILDALDPGLPAIVGGDLNGTRRSHAYRALTVGGFRDPQWEAGFGLGLTYPARHGRPRAGSPEAMTAVASAGPGVPLAHLPLVWFPVLRLDWILVRDLAPVDAQVGQPRSSDHRPVIVDVAFGSSDAP